MILFDWGTYNALTTLTRAAVLGMRLTEIPPADFSRRSRSEEYFRSYGEFSRKAFTTVTAHGPYYNVVVAGKEVRERIIRAFVNAVKMAALAGADVFNIHLGWKLYGGDRDIELASEVIKKLVEAAPESMYISLETTYTRRQLGSFEEIRSIIETVGSDRVIVSVQLENVFMYETGLDEHGNFELANKQATVDFWKKILSEALKLSKGYLSLRFSQVTGFYFGRRLLKKRVPLGRGYPDLGPLAKALAEFMVKEVKEKELPIKMHLIYTGPAETKYRDTIHLYATIMKEATEHL